MEKMPALLDVTGPNCGDCPYSWKMGEALACRRFPPKTENNLIPIGNLPREQQLRLPPEAARAGVVPVTQTSFPQVTPTLVCGEHPDFDIGEDEGKIRHPIDNLT